MKNTAIIAILCLAIGFASGWMFKPTPDQSIATNKSEETSSTRPTHRSTGVATSEKDTAKTASRSSMKVMEAGSLEDMDPETLKAIEDSQNRQTKILKKRIKDQFDTKIAAMVKELGLDPEQEKALKEFYAEQLEKISMNPMDMIGGGEANNKMAEIAGALRGDGLTDAMKDILSEEQLADLDTYEKRQKKNKVEAHAMKDLAKLQQSLDLTDDQKDEVYTVLVEDAEKSLESQSDADLVMRTMMSSMGVEMDLGDMDMGSAMQLAGDNNAPQDRASMLQQMKESRQKEIDTKVNRLAPHLTETQQQQYRKSLENKGGILNMMLNTSDEE